MKKNLITVLCLLTFAGSAFAEMYQIPGSYKETVTEVVTQPEGTTAQLEPTTKKEKGRFRMFWRKRKDYNPTTHIGTLEDQISGQVQYNLFL